MRGFFLLLLLTNVAFLGWQYLQHETQQQVDPYRGITFEKQGLTLLSELPPKKRPPLREGGSDDSADKTAQTVVTTDAEKAEEVTATSDGKDSSTKLENARACYRVNNVADRETADKLIAGLKKIGVSSLQEGSVQGQNTNYWVMLPPYTDRDQAAKAASRLSQKKVKDFFIIRSGDYQNAVSLGVFSSRERAKRRYNQVVALKTGLKKPKIEEINLPVKRYWVSWESAEKGQSEASGTLITRLGLEKSEEIACE